MPTSSTATTRSSRWSSRTATSTCCSRPAAPCAPPTQRSERRAYFEELFRLQGELVKLQDWVVGTKHKVVILFEGRDAAGKGGVIKRITQRLNPRVCRVAALPAPNDRERTQWYFQRYVAHLPAAGEIVLFDRSWYNRAGVERVMGFCSDDEYEEFFRTVPEFEKMLVRSGIQLIKYWFSITDEEQHLRFLGRIHDPLKQWKLSPMDLESRRRWEDYTKAKEVMLERTHIAEAPWWVVQAVDKKKARLNCIAHLLGQMPYCEMPHAPIALPERVRHADYLAPAGAGGDDRPGNLLSTTMSAPDALAVRVERADKTYAGGCRALRDLTIEVRRGERVALLGASGSGKSTLLRSLCALETLDAGPGCIELFGQPLQADGRIAPRVRALRRRVGIIFQQFNLVGRLPVLTNVLTGSAAELPLWRAVSGRFTPDEQARALDALVAVGLGDQAFQRASTLSGGQQQRAAIARALVQGAGLLLADEPVASLDPESTRRVMDLLAGLNARPRDDADRQPAPRRHRAALLRTGARAARRPLVFDGPTAALTPAFLRQLYGSAVEELLSPKSRPRWPSPPAGDRPLHFPSTRSLRCPPPSPDPLAARRARPRRARCECRRNSTSASSRPTPRAPRRALGAVLPRHGEEDRADGQVLLRTRLRRRDRGHALQQGPGRLVRQQVGDGSGGPRQRRSVRADDVRRRHVRLLRPADRAQGQPATTALDDVLKNSKSINFGIGDPNSTSGFLVPSFYVFAKNNVDHRSAFKTDRATPATGPTCRRCSPSRSTWRPTTPRTWASSRPAKPELASQIKVLWKSPLIPSDPFVWRKDLTRRPRPRCKSFVLGYAKTDPQEKAILKAIYNYGGFRGVEQRPADPDPPARAVPRPRQGRGRRPS